MERDMGVGLFLSRTVLGLDASTTPATCLPAEYDLSRFLFHLLNYSNCFEHSRAVHEWLGSNQVFLTVARVSRPIFPMKAMQSSSLFCQPTFVRFLTRNKGGSWSQASSWSSPRKAAFQMLRGWGAPLQKPQVR